MPVDGPYWGAGPGNRHALHALVLGIFALLCFGTGPVLGVAALVLGAIAKGRMAAQRRDASAAAGSAMATAAMLAGALSVVCFGVVAGLYLRVAGPPRASARAGRLSVEAPHAAAGLGEQSAAAPEPPPQTDVTSTVTTVGAVTVVDVAGGVRSLGRELREQSGRAAAHGDRMLVATVTTSCTPCQALAAALGDPRMQRALDHVRLVRIDRDQFEDDLEELEIPSKPLPSFFLLDADLAVEDAIDGGEWGADDAAARIAPVLGPFVRGTYTRRRSPWNGPLRPKGIML